MTDFYLGNLNVSDHHVVAPNKAWVYLPDATVTSTQNKPKKNHWKKLYIVIGLAGLCTLTIPMEMLRLYVKSPDYIRSWRQ
jgi:hypothetical protein